MLKRYVDDTSVLEVIPTNSISMLDIAVGDIHKYYISHRMKVNQRNAGKWLLTSWLILIL